MDTGQFFMQISAKSMVDFVRPVATAAKVVPAVKKDAQSFAGVLREVSPKSPTRTEHAARGEARREVPKKLEQSDEPVKEQMSARSSDGSNVAEKVVVKSDQEKKPVNDGKTEETSVMQPEVPMPQNVVQLATEAQAIIVQPLPEGRMPESVNPGERQNITAGKVESQNAADGPVVMMIPNEKQMAGVAVQTRETDPEMTTRAAAPETEKMKAVSLRPAAEHQPKQQVVLQQSEPVKGDQVAEMEMLPAGQSDGEKSTGSKAVVVAPAIVPAAGAEQILPASRVGTARPLPDSGQPVLNTVPVIQSAMPVLIGQQGAVAPERQTEKVQVLAASQEFRFSRSAAVEAALGTGGEVVDQPRVKGEVLSATEVKHAGSENATDAPRSGFNGSESGFGGNGAEGFSQQNPDLPKPGTLHAVNAPLNSAASLAVSSSTPATTQEQVRTASSEHIAGQVREQLASRNIRQGTEQITIQLSPDHLGDIKVSFRLEDQRLRVEIVADNRNARESLLQHADSLKESLSRQNINMEKFDVTGGSHGSSSQGGNSQPEWREMAKNRQSQQWLASGGYRTQPPDMIKQAPVYFARSEHSTLDLHF